MYMIELPPGGANSDTDDPEISKALPDWEIWACAHALEHSDGERAAAHIAERIGELVLCGDLVGVTTWKRIAAAFDALAARGKTRQ